MKQRAVRRTTLRLVVLTSVVLLISSGGYWVYFKGKQVIVSSYTPKSIVVSFDHIYSTTVQRSIEQFVHGYFKKSSFNSEQFHQNLKRNFKIVKNVSWHFDALQHMQCKIDGVQPLFLINQQYVLGNKRRLFACDVFGDISLFSLKPIHVNPKFIQEKIPDDLCKFLCSVPADVWKRYAINYETNNKIFLQATDQDQKYGIVGDGRLFLSIPFLHDQMLAQMRDDFLIRKKLVDRKQYVANRRVMYDVRFKNCVCVSLRMGDSCGGKNG